MTTIEVSYFDASAGVTRTATARADLVAPVLGTPIATNAFGETTVAWTSSEPSDAIVRYGTNASLASLNLASTNSELATSHAVSLEGLVPGRTYYYFVVSTDEAGNTTTNNGGSVFSFVMGTNRSVLLVDEYQTNSSAHPNQRLHRGPQRHRV
jgi:hypothetical protein